MPVVQKMGLKIGKISKQSNILLFPMGWSSGKPISNIRRDTTIARITIENKYNFRREVNRADNNKKIIIVLPNKNNIIWRTTQSKEIIITGVSITDIEVWENANQGAWTAQVNSRGEVKVGALYWGN